MPGMTISLTAGTADLRPQFCAGQAAMMCTPVFSASIALAAPGIVAGHVAYPEYPFLVLAHGNKTILLEGRIYSHNSSAIASDLRELADVVFGRLTNRRAAVRRWMIDHDGEFMVAILDRDRRELVLFNDALGRLPFFYHATDTSLNAARECKFFPRVADITFDRVGFAEMLWLGYPLGTRTLFHNVQRLSPGTLLSARAHMTHVACEVTQLVELNFDDKDEKASENQTVSDLIDLFEDSCSRRGHHPDVSVNLISLSGGLDSRAVAIGMERVGAPCFAATFKTQSGRAIEDGKMAKAITDILHMPWELMEMADDDEAEECRLVSLKDGHNYVELAFILKFMDRLVARFGRKAAYVTGDAGGKLLKPQIPPHQIPSMDELLQHIIQSHALLPSEFAEDVLSLRHGVLAEEMRQTLAGYPENNFARRVAHYFFHERGGQWQCEGEDRARFFMWQTSPFCSLPFTRRAMQVPDAMKANRRLYRAIQMKLSPEVARIPDANYGMAIASPLYGWNLRLHHAALKIPRGWRRRVQSALGHSRIVPVSESFLQKFPQDSIMNPVAVQKLLGSLDKRQFVNLKTLILLEGIWKAPSAASQAAGQA